MSDRIAPGQPDRAGYLDGLLKAALRAECDTLELEAQAAQASADELRRQLTEAGLSIEGLAQDVTNAIQEREELRAARDIARGEAAEARGNTDALLASGDGLRKAMAELEAEVVTLRRDMDAAESAPADGAVPMVLHFGGSALSNSQRQLVRCAPKGEYGEMWMVRIGSQIFTHQGHPIAFRPYLSVRPSLQSKVRFSYKDAQVMLDQVGRRPRRR